MKFFWDKGYQKENTHSEVGEDKQHHGKQKTTIYKKYYIQRLNLTNTIAMSFIIAAVILNEPYNYSMNEKYIQPRRSCMMIFLYQDFL